MPYYLRDNFSLRNKRPSTDWRSWKGVKTKIKIFIAVLTDACYFVAHLVEHWVNTPMAAGSSPVDFPAPAGATPHLRPH